MQPRRYLSDLNSASPGTKKQAAIAIEEAGGHYVEAGVMTSVPPYGIAVPMLLGGKPRRCGWLTGCVHGLQPHTGVTQDRTGVGDQNVAQHRDQGLEALVIEFHHGAPLRRGGSDARHAAETFPGIDWETRCLLLQPRGAAWQTPG